MSNSYRHRLVALAIALLPHASLAAQKVIAPSKEGDAAHLFAYYPKAGMGQQFDEGYRRHLAWHREKQDSLVWYAWYVEHGDRTGLFIDGSFGRPFAAFDERPEPAADGADFAQSVAPFANEAFRSTYIVRRDLSTGQPLEEGHPTRSVQVFHYRLVPGTERRFERAVLAARDGLRRLTSAPVHTWYELVVGGDQPTYMLMVARNGWADYDAFRSTLADLIVRGSEPGASEQLLADLAASAETVRTETWSYRSDLSYVPKH